jgi:tagaturonate reductase
MDHLNRQTAIKLGLTEEQAAKRPIKIIQFGEGGFLRAFVDWTVQELNNRNLFNGNIAIVQPLQEGKVDVLRQQDHLYTVVLQGISEGKTVQSQTLVDSIGQSVKVYDEWERYLQLADNPETQIIISNTTEAGIVIDDADTAQMCPPNGFPAKLVHLLKRRYDKHLPGFLIVPCELIADNGKALHDAVIEVSRRFGFDEEFVKWIDSENTFVSTLVDRIVPGYPAAEAESIFKTIGYEDDLLDKAEPFYSWVIAGDEQAQKKVDELLPAKKIGLNLVTTDDLQPYRERKVYLLNCQHTSLAQIARLQGIETVGDSMKDSTMRSFVLREMNEEVIPVLTLPEDELKAFASHVIERFSNPFNEHRLDSIGLNSVSKYSVRILPMVKRNVDRRGSLPKRLVLALAALLYTYGGFAQGKVDVDDSPEVMDMLSSLAHKDSYVHDALACVQLWGEDLTRIDGLEALVAQDFNAIGSKGIASLVRDLA